MARSVSSAPSAGLPITAVNLPFLGSRLAPHGTFQYLLHAIDVDGDWRAAGGEANESAIPPVDYVLPFASLRFLFPGESAVKLLITDDQGNLRDDVVIELGPDSF